MAREAAALRMCLPCKLEELRLTCSILIIKRACCIKLDSQCRGGGVRQNSEACWQASVSELGDPKSQGETLDQTI